MHDQPACSGKPYIAVFERKEKKYILDEERLSRFMALVGDRLVDDQYAHGSISSLYYDTPQFEMIDRSMEKPLYKEKLRVRVYGEPGQTTRSFVELKKKFNGIVYKRRACMSLEAAHAYLTGMPYEQAARAWPLAGERQEASSWHNIREIDACLTRHDRIIPAIMVIVSRHSLRSSDETNIRFTFDHDARWRASDLKLGQSMEGTALFADGIAIMEVKAMGALPLWLVRALGEIEAYPVSCSKVGLAYASLMRSAQAKSTAGNLYRIQPGSADSREDNCA